TLDPHSVLLDPETAREMDVSTSGKFGGLGIVIRMVKGKLTVQRPMKGTPAMAAGIQKNDHIYKINDELTENLTLNEAVSRMRGEPGSPIVLWVKRKSAPNPIRLEIKRAEIRVESVETEMLSDGVGYIQLKQFSGRSAREVKVAMDELKKKGAKGFILDMRANPGGLLEQAIKISDLFVDAGTIVTTVGSREREPRSANRKGTDTTSPIAVLVNGNSASASEIVSGALKNLDRALTIGSTTFGKGSVQVLYDNKDGSKLKLTIAEYLTPGDRSIQSLGITPDIELQRMVVSKQNVKPGEGVRLRKSDRSYREADLASHLISRYAQGADKPSYALPYLYEPVVTADDKDAPEADDPNAVPGAGDDDEDTLDDEFKEDFEVRLAKQIVAASTVPTRKGMIKTAKRIVAKQRAEEQVRLGAAMARLGVDWSAPPSVAGTAPALQATMRLDPGSGTIKAGSTIKLIGSVTNNGTGTAYQVHGRAKSDDYSFDEVELAFGKIDPGQTREWTSHIKVPSSARDRLDLITFDIGDARGAKAAVAPLRVRIAAADRPVFAYSYQLIDDGNGDGLVQPREQHRLRVEIKNTGTGTATETSAVLRNASGDGVAVKKGRFELGSMGPGSSKTVEFVLDITPEMSANELMVEMQVYDAVSRESVSEKLQYRMHPASAGPSTAGGAVQLSKRDAAIREGASSSSNTVAWAGKDAVFAVTGQQGDWLRIDLGNGRPGFVTADNASKSTARPQPTIQPNWQVTPPSLSLNIPSYEVTGHEYVLSGTASDDTHVEDVYIFVSNSDAKIDNKKVFYKSNRGAKRGAQMAFSSTIPLWPGSNHVVVVVRENDQVQSARSLYIYRNGTGNPVAAKK
ncbi:MAG TPA: MXAN_5808 family serine peptidase, partial [Kofleriaceae bacterium]|nr:MXAN_5808 family serine peptidase [Kofleriaceae bacterium]